MTQAQAETLADEYKTLVLARTKLTPDVLECPREKSEMTPCLARDGRLVVVLDASDHPICVGCETSLERLIDQERERKS
jgi:uncharacterized protein YhfF